MAATARLGTGAPRRRAGRGVAVPRLVAAAILLVSWQALALSGLLFRDVVPPLGAIARGFATVLADRSFYRDVAVTAYELALALTFGGVAGMAVGMLFGLSRFAARAYERWVVYLGPTPKIILFPVLIMLFGVGTGSKIAMGAISCFFPVAISIAAGVRAVNPTFLKVARSLRMGPWRTFGSVYLPAMAATLVNGLRLGFGIAVIGVLLAETKLSNQGVGFQIINAYTRFDMPRMYALLILVIVFAAAVNGAGSRLASRLGGRR